MENNKMDLGDKDVTMFWNKIVLPFEQEIKKTRGKVIFKHKRHFMLSPQQSQTIEKKYGIKIISIEDNKQQQNQFVFRDNQIVLKTGQGYIYYNLFHHIRNAFTHVNIQKDNGFFYMEDWENKQTKTLSAKIKIEDFEKYIDDIHHANAEYIKGKK